MPVRFVFQTTPGSLNISSDFEMSMKQFCYKNISVKMISTGGVESCYILPDYHIAFDMGRGPLELIDIPVVFLSHGHLDHAAGLAYYFSQRSLKNLGSGTIYAPPGVVRPFKKICKQWQKIEKFGYKIDIRPMKAGQRVEIAQNLFVEAHPACHRVDALGYTLIRKVKKLKQEYQTLPGEEIKKLKEQNAPIFEIREEPLFSYSGDTSIEFLLENELPRQARVLFMEATYIDEARTIERARLWGHTHLDEILEHRHLLENEKIVLVHLSRRYTRQKIKDVLKEKIPPEERGRFEVVL